MQNHRPPAQIQWIRGAIVESRHLVHVVVSNADGDVLLSAGNPDLPVCARSTAKPLQALEWVRSGTAQSIHLTDEEIAVTCGSHSGSHRHVEVVRSILWKGGVEERSLQCGVQSPRDEVTLMELRSEGMEASAIHNNCSGKHAGMLVTALHAGESLDQYLGLDHPVQRRIAANLCELTALEPGELRMGIDGCGAPTPILPLSSLAKAFARLAIPSILDTILCRAAERVNRAMISHPDMVAGPGCFDTTLLSEMGEGILCKSGAEGMFCASLKQEGLGLAIKVADGSGRAIPTAALMLLSKMDILNVELLESHTLLGSFYAPRILNTQGKEVGQVLSLFP